MMSSVVNQRDLVSMIKEETSMNIGILGKVRPMHQELTKLVIKDITLEKPTQNLFYHLSYYLVSIIDPKVGENLSWPLYDSNTERAYRIGLYNFITDYSTKGLIYQVKSSFLVNPNSFKVTVLLFQLSKLAINKILVTKMRPESQKQLYKEFTEKRQAGGPDFIEGINKEVEVMSSKLSNYLCKRQILESIANIMKKRIIEMDKYCLSRTAENYINNLVDGFLAQHEVDEDTKLEVLKIKNFDVESQIFENYLNHIDSKTDILESEWDRKVTPYLNICTQTTEVTEALILRYTGQLDHSLYTVEYNPKTDAICTKDLQSIANVEQKYVLMKLEVNGRLQFPNLIRAFLIAITYMLKNDVLEDDIYEFNNYLAGGVDKFKNIVSAMSLINEKVRPQIQVVNSTTPLKQFTEIPLIPDLSQIWPNINNITQEVTDAFTPINISKDNFNLQWNMQSTFTRPYPKPLIAPTFQTQKDDFIKSFISGNITSNYQTTASHSNNNLSVISHSNKGNDTVTGCTSGFTRDQLNRLLSIRKTSSSKKFKKKNDSRKLNIKTGALFNESFESVDSNGLFRSYSSPDLNENRKKSSLSSRVTNLSVMMECNSFNLSGISAFDCDNFSPGAANAESSRKAMEISNTLSSQVTSVEPKKILKEIINNNSTCVSGKSSIECVTSSNGVTPKSDFKMAQRTSSLEKIINRFQKVRANVVSNSNQVISEEKVNLNTQNNLEKRRLLPDLLSPSWNMFNTVKTDSLQPELEDDDIPTKRYPRESLGSALGVDHTFLDQFELSD
ncbi:unnamed protein product [Leptidea sinapis]|uniref:HAUS augmin-like complex subunit 6 N-terminal domain-containing protein n=1 Tax=Leptidea sinapis TaxID=189913 RepID=A0A5E4QCM3_9NEOP|nr:unnamed protein product [Leptidea sinapis]